jgi:hypothetical protein
MKLCKDCKWLDGRYCYAPVGMELDVVYGGYKMKWNFESLALIQRNGGWFSEHMLGRCGRRGRFFEPKEDGEMTDDKTLYENTGTIQNPVYEKIGESGDVCQLNGKKWEMNSGEINIEKCVPTGCDLFTFTLSGDTCIMNEGLKKLPQFAGMKDWPETIIINGLSWRVVWAGGKDD